MDDLAVVVFTSRGFDRLLREGGSCSWVLNKKRASSCKYVVCVQNREPANHNNDWGEASAPHKNAFFIGKISEVILSPEWDGNNPKRWLIKISDYAKISYPNMWGGMRNPVTYSSLKDLGIDESKLNFIKMPYVDIKTPNPVPEYDIHSNGISLSEAKLLLSKKYNIPEKNIEIVIRS